MTSVGLCSSYELFEGVVTEPKTVSWSQKIQKKLYTYIHDLTKPIFFFPQKIKNKTLSVNLEVHPMTSNTNTNLCVNIVPHVHQTIAYIVHPTEYQHSAVSDIVLCHINYLWQDLHS